MQQVVADNLAAEVARKRLTGRKMASELGLGQMYVARRLSGQTAIDVNDLALFADYLGIDPSILLKTEMAPTPESESHTWAVRDSNPRPSGCKPDDSNIIPFPIAS